MNIKKTIIAIPARLESTRLPNKVIEDICGKTMIERVLENCLKNKVSEYIFLCTDSYILRDIAEKMNIKVFITEKNCRSGSERIAKSLDRMMSYVWDQDFTSLKQNDAYQKYKETLIINVQGDQPLLDPEIINQTYLNFCKTTQNNKVITPIFKIQPENIFKEEIVKIIVNKLGNAIYFSRAVIPFIRGEEISKWNEINDFFGHVGIYGYRGDILKKWNDLSNSELENLEGLEQLRLIDSGYDISTFKVEKSTISVDTKEQLLEAIEIFKKKNK